MKKIAFTALFVFSIVLNLAVAATLGWHYWRISQIKTYEESKESLGSKHDLKAVRKLWPKDARREMMDVKRRIREKRAEVLDILAANPGKPDAAKKAVTELVALWSELEHKAVINISAVMEKLPEEKRGVFVEFLKKRAMKGQLAPGPHGRHRRGWSGHEYPGGAQNPPGTQDSAESSSQPDRPKSNEP